MQGLAYFPCDFFCEWIAGQDSVACQTIPNTVQGISSASLHELLEQLRACAIDSSSCGWASLVRCGLHVDRFLMLLHVLLRSTNCTVRYTAALIMLAALRCKGALHHGVLHPMCFIQLVNTLGEFLASSAIQFSVPMDVSQEILMELELLLCTVSVLVARCTPSCATAFRVLLCCTESEHGNLEEIARIIFHSLLPTFLLATEHGSSTLGLAAQKASAEFVCDVWEKHKASEVQRQAILQVVLAMLQHVTTHAPDRSEKRFRICSVLSGLLLRLPAQLAACYSVFLWTSSSTEGVPTILCGVQTASSFLQAAAGCDAPPFEGCQTPQLLWRFIIKQCAHRLPRVRSQALHSLAALLRRFAASPECAVLLRVQQPLAPQFPSSSQLRAAALRDMQGVALPCSSRLEEARSAALLQGACSMKASLPELASSMQDYLLDDCATVRHAAVLAVHELLHVNGLTNQSCEGHSSTMLASCTLPSCQQSVESSMLDVQQGSTLPVASNVPIDSSTTAAATGSDTGSCNEPAAQPIAERLLLRV